jgi:Arylsulfotransferase (ASST)
MELPDGDLLVSFREISTIIKIERRTGRIVWKLGAPPLSGQQPTPLPNVNILISTMALTGWTRAFLFPES